VLQFGRCSYQETDPVTHKLTILTNALIVIYPMKSDEIEQFIRTKLIKSFPRIRFLKNQKGFRATRSDAALQQLRRDLIQIVQTAMLFRRWQQAPDLLVTCRLPQDLERIPWLHPARNI